MQKIHKFNNDVKNKWVIIKGLIRKDPQRRSAFPGKIVFDDKTMTNEKDTTKKKIFILEIRPALVDKITSPKRPFKKKFEKSNHYFIYFIY